MLARGGHYTPACRRPNSLSSIPGCLINTDRLPVLSRDRRNLRQRRRRPSGNKDGGGGAALRAMFHPGRAFFFD